MEFYRIWRILVGHKWILIWLPLIATCVGVGLTYVLPEQYASTALVVDRPFEPIRFGSNGDGQTEILGFPLTLSAPIDTPGKTYIEIIESPAVAVRIVDALRLNIYKPKKYSNLFESIRDKVKTWLRDTIRIARNYLKYGRDIHASPFELAVENLEDNLVVTPKNDTYAFAITYRSSDPKQAAAVANMAAEIFLELRSKGYRSDAARAREFIGVQLDKSRTALEQARAAMLAYKNSSNTFDLNSEYKDQLKTISDLEDTLARTEDELAGLQSLVRGGDTRNIIERQAEIANLNRQILTLRIKLTAYPREEARLDALSLAERLARGNYEFFFKRYEEARVKEAADVSEIRIASRAVPSLYPVKPLKYVYGGLSFATAMVLAIGWVLFFEALDPRIRTLRDLDDDLGVPVLAAIPTLKHSWWAVETRTGLTAGDASLTEGDG